MREIVTVVGTSPTLFHTVQEDYRIVVREITSYVDGPPGGYVRRWARNGDAVQVFGSWIGGGSGGALHWDDDAAEPEAKARQIARDRRIRFLDEAGFTAWKSQQKARPVRGDLFVISHDDDGEEQGEELEVDWRIPNLRRGAQLVHRDASGTYAVTPVVAGQKNGGTDIFKVRSLYALTRGDTVQARVERPYRDYDRVGLLIDAIRAALADAASTAAA
ncbi:hypothetical protein [Methylobacterium ajmalii]|jgi:hypothetical protein|uniref:hypothetical protein n=1 Tax=Methylobacterium ajmalii TaxID=2738439 RepID=UPI00190BBA2A|nr:hypothetical protein [Methylobacterium ajmalii]MBK3400856.1 hypothetical protein [Methylobacterium ajmalii]MBK3410931.1 hypothetical protein [Methylobacterium ajmalii]MBK3421906.1 hypothetical protein [Methylobacterium ajmalii]MBZ6415701.1 hypothetical protein [Methylobacterium sp.]